MKNMNVFSSRFSDFLYALWMVVLRVVYVITEPIRDDEGRLSSIRVTLILAIIITYDLVSWWKGLVEAELARPGTRDIAEVSNLIFPLVSIIITAVIAKIIQKKFEKKA